MTAVTSSRLGVFRRRSPSATTEAQTLRPDFAFAWQWSSPLGLHGSGFHHLCDSKKRDKATQRQYEQRQRTLEPRGNMSDDSGHLIDNSKVIYR